ncbi:MAG: hypothetical protein V3U51_01250 [Thermoplasmata archaeon]
MEENDELTAMSSISKILDSLKDPDTQGRVIRWVVDKYGVSIYGEKDKKPSASIEDMESLEDLWVAASPKTQPMKVLVVGTWFQVRQGQQNLKGFQVNKPLKNLGHGIKDITGAFNQLIETKPALAIQVKKSGTTKQARKEYRITREGIQKVEEMITAKGKTEIPQ